MLQWPAQWRVALLVLVAILAAIPFARRDRIPQDPAYHQFADDRALFGIPNFANVGSNFLFAAVGAYGMAVVLRRARRGDQGASLAYAAFFCGVILTCFGSAYYHWEPSNTRLAWDRLPMSVGFMGLLSATIAERVNMRLGKTLLGPLLLLGIASVLLWSMTEAIGRGDLRLYYAVQYGTLLMILLLLALFPSFYSRSWELLLALILYAVAKVFETYDRSVLQSLGISGHTIKHAIAAASVLLIAHMLSSRSHQTPAVAFAVSPANASKRAT